MRSKWFRQFFDPKTQKKYFHKHPGLFNFDRECAARGVAIGLFIGMIPVLPLQTFLVILLCIILRGNFPLAFLVSWISNPITILPLTYLTYRIGEFILGVTPDTTLDTVQSVSLQFATLQVFFTSFYAWILQFGKAFFIGLPIISLGAGLIGYLFVHIFWDISHKIYFYFKR